MRSLEAFHSFDAAIECVIVLPKAQIEYWDSLCKQYGCTIPHTVVEGGSERFLSVRNGLQAISVDGVVAVHDGVRPLLTETMLREGFETAEKFGSGVPYVDSVDSLRIINGDQTQTLDRNQIKRIQTPQIFNARKLRTIMNVDYQPQFTDEATVWELAGEKLHFYKGDTKNIKITTPEDLRMAEVLL